MTRRVSCTRNPSIPRVNKQRGLGGGVILCTCVCVCRTRMSVEHPSIKATDKVSVARICAFRELAGERLNASPRLLQTPVYLDLSACCICGHIDWGSVNHTGGRPLNTGILNC